MATQAPKLPWSTLEEYDQRFRLKRNLHTHSDWRRFDEGGTDHDLNDAYLQASKSNSHPAANISSGRRSGGKSTEICHKWNSFSCSGPPGCVRRHECQNCGSRKHKKRDCSQSSASSASRRSGNNHGPDRQRSRSPRGGNYNNRQVPSPFPSPAQVCPFILDAWEFFSRGFPDGETRAWVLQGISQGFRLGFDHSAQLGKVKTNAPSVEANSQVVSDYLDEEVALSCIAGPFASPPWLDLHRNRISVIPKAPELDGSDQAPPRLKTDAYRIIVDLSSPQGRSVNAGIPDAEAKVSYCSLSSILDELVKRGPSTLLGKIDFKRAYRQLAVHVDDRKLLGMFFNNQWYVDLTLPFGGRSCAKIFNTTANVARFAFSQAAPDTFIDHYLDDFATLSGAPDTAANDFEAIVARANAMGIPLSLKKLQPPGESIIFLGFTIHAPSLTVSIPEAKRRKYGEKARALANRSHASQEELLSIAGCLIHCSEVLPQGKPFLRSVFTKAHSVSRKSHKVNLNLATRADLAWWADILESWVGSSLLCRGAWSPDVAFAADASGSLGLGIFTGSLWCAEPWPSFEGRATNIAILEMVPLLVAATLWGPSWERKRVLFQSDNMAVVYAVNGWLPKDDHLVSLLKRLAKLSVLHNFRVRCEHLPGVRNIDADLLSRDRINDFLTRNAGASLSRVRVPQDLLFFLTSPPPP